ncbi:hypothetical protein SH2C18_34050 [Clostridium sediminicola]|uniref:shikimate dehydrogenase n=1 Tax=Clostridium sediminicola TaxID=3114879 RepID=UPI0031F20C0A
MKILCGLLGEKLGHSYSPQIHSSLFEKINLDAYYHLFEVNRNDLSQVVNSMKVLNICGLNVTIPYKVDIMNFIDEISSEAAKIGAVNTIALKNGKTIGYNTDYFGFGAMLQKYGVETKNKKVILLGTGGAAKAAYQYFIDNDIKEIKIVSRNNNIQLNEYEDAEIISYSCLESIKDFDIIVNCTPVGMYPKVDKSPVDKEILLNYKIAVDMIYNPEQTLFLKYANELGLKTVNGLYMLISQAIKAEELWNEIEVNYKITNNISEEIKKKLKIMDNLYEKDKKSGEIL